MPEEKATDEGEASYVQLELVWNKYMSAKTVYDANGVISNVVPEDGKTVRVRWGDGSETREEFVGREVIHHADTSGRPIPMTGRGILGAVKVTHRGGQVVLESLDGLEVDERDIKERDESRYS
ncbi:MAG: hypothetical protein KKF56_00005 [Nanoarchaeota archaeon]|nr:hypothetical protein [Nanoarchaeota archaeon]